MDHSHSGAGDDMAGMDGMHGHGGMMPMTFHFSTTGEVLFTWWNMSGAISLFLSCLVVLLLSCVKVWLQRKRVAVLREHSKQEARRQHAGDGSVNHLQPLVGRRRVPRTKPPVVVPALLLLASTTLSGGLMLGASASAAVCGRGPCQVRCALALSRARDLTWPL